MQRADAVIPAAQEFITALRGVGVRGVVILIDGDEKAVDGQPVYVTDLPRETGVGMMEHILADLKANREIPIDDPRFADPAPETAPPSDDPTEV